MKKKIKKVWHQQKAFAFDVAPFETDLVVFINPTEEFMKKSLKDMMGKGYANFDEREIGEWDSSKTDKGRLIKVAGGFAILVKANKNQFREFVGVLTHEIVHAVQYILRQRRIGLSEETEEVHAYLTENLLVRILKELY